MAKTLTPEEAIDRARKANEDRIEAIRHLAVARQRVADAQAELAAAEKEDLRLYQAAVSRGWTTDELKRIGYEEPAKKQRARKRAMPSDGVG